MKNGKKQKTRILFFILFCVALFTSCGAPRAVRKRRKIRDISLAKIQVKRTLTIGIRDDFPPFVRFNEGTGEPEGFDIETAKLVCGQMNVKPEFKVINWKERNRLLKTEKIDCIWSAFSSRLAYEADILTSKPYIKTCYVIGVLENSPLILLEDLVKKNIGIDYGLSDINIFQNTAQKDSGAFKTFYYDNLRDCLSDFEYRNLDGIVGDLLLINDLINVEGKPYRILDEALGVENYVIGFRKQDILLAKRVQDILENLEYRGQIKPIAEKWFGSDITVIGK